MAVKGFFLLCVLGTAIVSGLGEEKSSPVICKVAACSSCESSLECKECEEGFYLRDKICFPCTRLDINCTKCSDFRTCTECAEGLFLTTTGCTSCSVIEGCSLCSSETECEECDSGYSLNESTGLCEACEASAVIENCAVCAESIPTGDNLIGNGDFESPNFTVDGPYTDFEELVPDMWTSDPWRGEGSLLYFGSSPEGTQVAQIIDGEVLKQDLPNLSRGTFLFSFYYGTPVGESSNELEVYLNGLIGSFPSVPIDPDLEFVAFEVDVIPFDDLELEIEIAGNYGNYIIEGVSLRRVVSGCTSCKTGFYSFESSCLPCSSLEENCETCSSSACSTCASGFVLDSSMSPPTCVECAEAFENCWRCSESEPSCIRCLPGYSLTEEGCVPYGDLFKD